MSVDRMRAMLTQAALAGGEYLVFSQGAMSFGFDHRIRIDENISSRAQIMALCINVAAAHYRFWSWSDNAFN